MKFIFGYFSWQMHSYKSLGSNEDTTRIYRQLNFQIEFQTKNLQGVIW